MTSLYNALIMLLLEHLGKSLLRHHGIAVPTGRVVRSMPEFENALGSLPSTVVLKAQIGAGRRGKSGGILFANTAGDARSAFRDLMSKTIEGHTAESVLVEERIAYERERYAGISTDSGQLCLMFAKTGGVEIEELTAADPSNFVTVPIDPVTGPRAQELEDNFRRLGYAEKWLPAYKDIALKLFQACIARDALLIEINPLVECSEGELRALDARVSVDENALRRQLSFLEMLGVDGLSAGTKERVPGLRIKHNPQGGTVGLIGLGSGLNATLMDWLSSHGSVVRSLVDVDEAIASGRAKEGFSTAFEAFDNDPGIVAILVNIITCGYELDSIVSNLLSAFNARGQERVKPIVLHLRGNAMAETPAMLSAAGLVNSPSLGAAIARMAELARAS